MNGKVPAFHAVIQMGKEGHALEVSLDGSKGLGQGMDQPSLGGKEVRGMETEGIADANQPLRRAVRYPNTRSTQPFRQAEGFQSRQSQDTHGSTQEQSTVHA